MVYLPDYTPDRKKFAKAFGEQIKEYLDKMPGVEDGTLFFSFYPGIGFRQVFFNIEMEIPTDLLNEEYFSREHEAGWGIDLTFAVDIGWLDSMSMKEVCWWAVGYVKVALEMEVQRMILEGTLIREAEKYVAGRV